MVTAADSSQKDTHSFQKATAARATLSWTSAMSGHQLVPGSTACGVSTPAPSDSSQLRYHRRPSPTLRGLLPVSLTASFSPLQLLSRPLAIRTMPHTKAIKLTHASLIY